MIETRQPEKVEVNGWHFRIQSPELRRSDQRVMLLLHGYQGNENVMWILTKPLPKDYLLIAPRAPIQHGDGQYIWHEIAPQWPDVHTYQLLGDQLFTRVDQWLDEHNIKTRKFDLMGFSQGAVLAYALAILQPSRINRVAALAGFIPKAWKDQMDVKPLENIPFFIAHGTQDDIIPIQKAHRAANWLEENGAQVTFCEAEIGHKLSANCFDGLGSFFD
ncbi:MAG: alpha/beta hydrolase [Brevefilum sp.]